MSSSRNYRINQTPPILFIPEQSRLLIDQVPHSLEPLQARMLMLFINKQREVLSTAEIAEAVWQRTQVSDNLVRQVISGLRTRLQDKRPYSIIRTIPKCGYVLDSDITELDPEPECQPVLQPTYQEQPATILQGPALQEPVTTSMGEATTIRRHPQRHAWRKLALVALAALVLVALVLVALLFQSPMPHSTQSAPPERVVPVILHDLQLGGTADEHMAASVYEYLFFGLSTSKQIIIYRQSQLSPDILQQLASSSLEVKGHLTGQEHGYPGQPGGGQNPDLRPWGIDHHQFHQETFFHRNRRPYSAGKTTPRTRSVPARFHGP